MRVFEEPAYGDNLPRGYTPPPHVAAGPRTGAAQPTVPTFTIPGQAEAEQLVRALDGAIDGVTSALDEKLGFVAGGAAAAAAAARAGAEKGATRDAADRLRAKMKSPAATRGVVPASGLAGGMRTPLGPMVVPASGAKALDLRAELSQERLALEADVAHLRHRCASLEKENAFLRTQATAAEEQDPLVDQLMAQVSLLMAEKGRLAADNARLGAENHGLQELLAYTSALAQGAGETAAQEAQEPREGSIDGGEEPEAPFPHTPPQGAWKAPLEGFGGRGGEAGAGVAGALFPSGHLVGAGESPLESASGGLGSPLTPEKCSGCGGGCGGCCDFAAGAAVDPSDGLADVSHVSESWSELGKDSEDEGDEWDNRSAHTDCTDPYCPGAPASEGSDEEDDAWIAE